MATPTLRAIRSRFERAHITFLTEPNLRDLIRGGDWMDECIEWPLSPGLQSARSFLSSEYRDLIWDLRRRRFDWALLLPNSFRAALLARLAGAKRRIGYNRDGRGLLLTDRLPVKNRRKRGAGVPGRRKGIGSAPPYEPLLQEQWHTAEEAPLKEPWHAGGSSEDETQPSIQTLLESRGTRRIAREESADVTSRRRNPPQSSLGNGGSRRVATSGAHKEPGPLDEEETGRFRPDAPVKMGANLPVRPGRFEPMPLVDYYADLAEAMDCDRPGDRLELFTTVDCEESVGRRLESLGAAHRRPSVVISPGARYGAAKCWAPERFAAVADRLVEFEGAVVLITCGPGEESIARQIGAAMQREGIVLDAPRLTLGEMKSLVRRSDLLLCNDAGPRHFAKAFDVPVVTIFGPTHPKWTATSYESERIVRVDVDCGPCQQRICPLGHVKCMTDVTVAMVFAACRELLGLRKPEARSRPKIEVRG